MSRFQAWPRPDCAQIAYRLCPDCILVMSRLCPRCGTAVSRLLSCGNHGDAYSFHDVRRAVLPLPRTEQVGMRPILMFFVLLLDYQPVTIIFHY